LASIKLNTLPQKIRRINELFEIYKNGSENVKNMKFKKDTKRSKSRFGKRIIERFANG